MKNKIFIVLAGILLFSCSSTLRVTSEVDPEVDFSSFKTLEYYGWTEESRTRILDYYRVNIEKSFGNEFLNRGIKTVKKGEGDIIVSLHIIIRKKIETVAETTTTNIGTVNYYGGSYGYAGSHGYIGVYGYGGFYGYGPNYAWRSGYTPSITTYSDREYDDGTLIVSVYDAKKKELIWEAAGSKPLDIGVTDINEKEESMRNTVAKIMKKYPVQSKK